MAVGLAVVLGLAIAHWSTIRDHIEAWHFQLTSDSETIAPEVPFREPPASGVGWLNEDEGYVRLNERDWCRVLANFSGDPVIRERDSAGHFLTNVSGPHEGWGDLAHRILEDEGWRVIKQRFPRRAYVVISKHMWDPLEEEEEATPAE
jgi:hypothetical protein